MQIKIISGVVVAVLTGCSADDGGSVETDIGTTGGATSTTTSTATSTSTTTSTSSSTSTSSTSDSGSESTTADTGSESSSSDSSTTGAELFELTSPAFQEGGIIPSVHHIAGGNVSPALDWTSPPAGTLSIGVFFRDLTIDFDHSAIWNIPPDALGLPEGVEAVASPPSVPGALQCRHWNGGFGYGGPGSSDNFYEFTVYALNVAELPGVDENSNRSAVRAALEAAAIETATLSGQTAGPP